MTDFARQERSVSAGYTYGPDGSIAPARDENHTTPNTTYGYDPAGRLTSVTQTLATASGGQIVTHYGYDIQGNLTSVTDPNGNVTTYVYDDFGRMLSQSSPVTGTTVYSYDLTGNLVSWWRESICVRARESATLDRR